MSLTIIYSNSGKKSQRRKRNHLQSTYNVGIQYYREKVFDTQTNFPDDNTKN